MAARGPAGNRRRAGITIAPIQAWHGAVHARAAAVELGSTGRCSAKRPAVAGTADRLARLLKRRLLKRLRSSAALRN